jgi:hypothetical protein
MNSDNNSNNIDDNDNKNSSNPPKRQRQKVGQSSGGAGAPAPGLPGGGITRARPVRKCEVSEVVEDVVADRRIGVHTAATGIGVRRNPRIRRRVNSAVGYLQPLCCGATDASRQVGRDRAWA